MSAAVKGQNPSNARSRRQNGEGIGPKDPPGTVVLLPRGFWPEIEAILTSFRDLNNFVHCFVGKLGNIDIFLALANEAMDKIVSNLERAFDGF
ncbi:hypothetical protein [Sphingopyxis sp.]|uniref:hypothetical protein n=1 Tax=Sphingopyxis sp. TaxID=1908224 RepID=UPI002B47B7FA|nr:hypothetical protein [Sphingopyxis sp.]HJS10706.1 hypothetical protein [Sphingopyxis sp.]